MNQRASTACRAVIIAQCLVLTALLAWRHGSPPPAAAALHPQGHSSSDPESFIIPVTEISLDRDDGTHVTVWSGSQDVDLAGLTSLADLVAFQGEIPQGRYTRIQIFCGSADSTMIRVKGSVVSGGHTYYTKASHTGYADNPPAELEEFPATELVEGSYSLSQTFSPAITIGATSSVSEICALVDISNALIYYDGTGPAPDPYYMISPGFYLQRSAYAITVGKPGAKEVYDIYTTSSADQGRLTILYDAADQVIGSNVRQVLVNNSLGCDIFPTWAPTLCAFTDNGDGSSRLVIHFGFQGQFSDSEMVSFLHFRRASHTGDYSLVSGGHTRTGTYTCSRE